jgi:hypothetical protein
MRRAHVMLSLHVRFPENRQPCGRPETAGLRSRAARLQPDAARSAEPRLVAVAAD